MSRSPRKDRQDGGGIERGDHYLPHKIIKRSFECWETSTKQLLNAGGGHQALRKAAQSLQKDVGENLKEENRDKNLGTETHLREGVVKEEKFPYSRKPSHRCVCQKFGTSKGTITKRKEKKKKPTEYVPNHNYKWRQKSGTDAHIHQQRVGAGQEIHWQGPRRWIRHTAHLGPPSYLRCLDLGRAQKAQPISVCAPAEHPRTWVA